ncbi:ABC transporter substrate-binding protein [Calycomorphotria hydatis]|uniref:Vitamin B12-transporter protein BtuF n=1 Tax=Calycomorphotria hydatis TaxID=2528027 RepID=A0A517TDT2_9PLAN|nr:ABC transporter substrate-binding protein [Calycomorphotria hydatis]QDT66531.1 vitamin B12-transporter protein BtuF [Calycomorphotria hydatis]
MPEATRRIVSLIPAATEIVCALDLEDQLVGRSHSCDYPPSIAHLPECTSVNIDITASSREIDQQVRDAGTSSVYQIEQDTLRELQPDVIITQGICELCAAGPSLVHDAVNSLDKQPRVFALKAERLEEVWNEIDELAEFLDVKEQGAKLTTELRQRTSLPATVLPDHRPTIAFLDWIDPLMTAGHWVPDVLTAGGAQDVFSAGGSPSRELSWEELIAAQPDMILIAPCGFDIERTMQELPALTDHPRWSELKAVQNDAVFLADGRRLFNRPSCGLADSVEVVRQIVNGVSPRAHWQPLSAAVV